TRDKAEAEVSGKKEGSGKKEVRIKGGSTRTDAQLGMDAEGSLDAGIRITPDAVLSVAADGKVKQTKGQALTTGTLKAVDTTNGAITFTTRAGTELVLYLASDTEVHLSGSSARAADLSGRIGAEAVAKYNAETKALSSLVVASDFKKKAQVSADLALSGEIKSVDVSKGTVTIKTDAGASVTLKLGKEAKLNLDGVTSGPAGLEGKAGARIKVGYDANTGQLKELKEKTEVEAEASVTGTLKVVSPSEGTVTVTTAAGAEVVLKVASSSKVMVNGTLSTLGGLKQMIGSEVTLEYEQETKVVGELKARGEVKGAEGVTGIIKAVNPAKGTVTITTPSGQEVVLNVTAGSSLVADGAISSLAGMAGKVGEEFSAEFDSKTKSVHNLKARAQTNARVSGTLSDVDVNGGTITIATQTGGDVTLKVDASSELEAGGEDVTLEELGRLIGAQVTAEFNAQAMIATEVKAAGKAAAAGKASGAIKSVDAAAGAITITLEAGGDLTLKTTGDSTILVSGARSALADLISKVGSRTIVEYATDTKVVTRLVVVGAGSTRANVAGTLKLVDLQAGAVTIAPQTGGEVVLKVNYDTKILIRGKASTLAALAGLAGSPVAVQYVAQTSAALSIEAGGRTLETAETKEGGKGQSGGGSGSEIRSSSGAGSEGTSTSSEGSGASARTTASATGSLKAVDPEKNTVTIVVQGTNETLVLKVTSQSRILVGDGASSILQLATLVGSQVVVEYDLKAMTVISLKA
ncbi:MAG: hypothetical protein HY533_00950, partial [Chloroflexi bacterium]|nr:hypothetical protein [Chloroflexota bacterium]